jgi:hypothetical protein
VRAVRHRLDEETSVKISFARWAVGCVLVSGVVGTLLLPGSDDRNSASTYWDYSFTTAGTDLLWQRNRAVSAHERNLMSRYESAVDVTRARRAFASPAAPAAPAAQMVVQFAPDVPAAARHRVSELIDAERNARPAWRGHGPVGVLVITDTATTLRGAKLPQRFDRDRQVTTAVLPPSSATGGRCVTVVRLRHTALVLPPTLVTGRLPMDGCAFEDAFGAPGPWMTGWLARERFRFARRLALVQPAVERDAPRYQWDQGGIASMQCRGGSDSACIYFATSSMAGMRAVNQYYAQEGADDRVESLETLMRFDPTDEGLLESLARDLGPARFQRIWKSSKPLAESYFDETGESFAHWERSRLIETYGPYRSGPAPSTEVVIITLTVVALIALLSFQRAARPSLA